MKRLVLFIISLTIPPLLFSQVYKSGTISSPETWSGIVYLSGNVTITSSVTINAGTKVLFKGNSAIKLIIDGAGSVTATGSSGNEIYFSADDDEDGVYGENNERGLKIQLYPSSGSSGSSSFSYCIFEYIDCSNESGNNAYGALDLISRPVTFENSIFRNNKADYGGAIFLRNNSNITLNKCTFENNSADNLGGALYFGAASGVINNCILKNNSASSGGGFYVYQGGPSFTNCLIYSNSVTGSGSGIYLNQASSSFKMVNTTCSKNINSGSSKDFQFNGVSGQQPKIVNSIIWGSNIGTLDATLITIVNSAIQGFTNYNSHVASISLSSNNTGDPTSPYFSNPGGYDFSLHFISPCRDAGVNSYSGVTIPTTDCLGNSTIHNKDIGAYEVQYSRWKTTPSDIYTWSAPGNWELGIYPGHATATGDVLIPALSTSAAAPDVSSVTVQPGKYMIMEPGAKASIGTLTNNGTFRMESDATGMSSLIVDSYSGNDAEVELYLTGGPVGDNYRWHFISSPFTSLDTSYFWANNSQNLACWVESYNRSSLTEGWFAADGWFYPSGPITTTRFSNLNPGQGYMFYYKNDTTFVIKGNFNTSSKDMTLGFSDINLPGLYGHNLFGNPFPSGLDWDVITGDPGYPENTSKVLHILKDGDYVYYITGIGTEGGATGIIPPMQGFFTKTYATGKVITLPTEARVLDNIPQRYKGTSTIPYVRLKLSSGNLTDNMVVRFDNRAKAGLDYDYDAEKFIFYESKPYIWSVSEGVKFAINGLPFPETTLEVPLTVRLTSSGIQKIISTDLKGLENYSVILKDKVTGFQADLKSTSEVTFTSDAGTINNRFILIFDLATTKVDNISSVKDQLNLFCSDGYLNIQIISDAWNGKKGTVTVVDLAGRTVKSFPDLVFEHNGLMQLPFTDVKGVYLVEVRSGFLKHVRKVLIK